MNMSFYIPTEIVQYIRDIAFDTPKNNYNKVMKELEKIHKAIKIILISAINHYYIVSIINSKKLIHFYIVIKFIF